MPAEFGGFFFTMAEELQLKGLSGILDDVDNYEPKANIISKSEKQSDTRNKWLISGNKRTTDTVTQTKQMLRKTSKLQPELQTTNKLNYFILEEIQKI